MNFDSIDIIHSLIIEWLTSFLFLILLYITSFFIIYNLLLALLTHLNFLLCLHNSLIATRTCVGDSIVI